MQFNPFFDEFPELITSEFRNIFIENDPIIPAGNYAFNEFYCTDLNCDCQKVIIHIITENSSKVWAIINYGWQSEKFYKKWFGKSQLLYMPMSGAHADPFPNDLTAKALTKVFESMIQYDKAYSKRLESHYWQFKDKIQKQQDCANQIKVRNRPLLETKKEVGRNDLCPCNSGKKFKKCCLD